MLEPNMDPEDMIPGGFSAIPYYGGDGLFGVPGFLASAAQVPREAWAPVVGTLIAWGLTQRLKFLLPPTWSRHARELGTQAIGFTTGFVATALVWGPKEPLGWITGFVVGLWSPALWNVSMFLIGKRWPRLRKHLSQDKRG